MKYTHFHVTENRRITLFNLGNCEDCGAVVQEPNAVQGCDPKEYYMVRLNMIALPILPSELWWSEAFGGGVCKACYKKHEGVKP